MYSSTNAPEKNWDNLAQYRLKLLNYRGDAFTKTDHFVNTELWDNIINELKLGKAAGINNLTAERLNGVLQKQTKWRHPHFEIIAF